MRSRKKVLVYAGREDRGRETAYVLNLRGYDPYWVEERGTLGRVLEANQFHAAVVLDTGELDHAESAVRAIRQADPGVMVVLWLAGMSTIQTQASRVLAHDVSASEMLEVVRIACTRKRGPKPLQAEVPAAVAHLGAVPA